MSEDASITELDDFLYEDIEDIEVDEGEGGESLSRAVPALLQDASTAFFTLIERVEEGLTTENYIEGLRQVLSLVQTAESTGDENDDLDLHPEDKDPGVEKKTEKRDDGTVVVTYEDGSTLEQRTATPSLRRDKDGRIMKIVRFGGDTTAFGYGEDGKVNRYRTSDGTWTTTDGRNWHHIPEFFGRQHGDWKGTINISRDGVLERFEEKTGVTHRSRLDGSWRVTDKRDHILQERKPDGTFIRSDYSTGGELLTTTEYGRDGFITVVDAGKRLLEVYPPDGNFRHLHLGEGGKLSGIQMSDGSRWESMDGKTFNHSTDGRSITGEVELTRDGTVTFRQADRKSFRLNVDGSVEQLEGTRIRERKCADGSIIWFDTSGRVQTHTGVDGRSREFAYVASRLSSVKEPDGSLWESSDGKNWNRKGASEVRQEVRSIALDGTYKVERNDKSSTTTRPDGSIICTDSRSCIVAVSDKFGRRTNFGYAEDGRLNSITHSDGSNWTSADGKSWKNSQTEQTLNAEIEILSDGSIKDKTAEPERTTVTRIDGVRRVSDRNGTCDLEQRKDGSTVVKDSQGRISEVWHPDGTARQYRYNGASRVIEMSEGKWSGRAERAAIKWDKTLSTLDGVNWSTRDEKTKWRGDVFVGCDGSQRLVGTEGTRTLTRSDGSVVATKDGRVLFVRKSGGAEMRAEYNDSGEITKFKNGRDWTTTDGGKTWISGKQTFSGELRFLADGTLQTTTSDKVFLNRLDHGQLVKDKSGKVLYRFVPGEAPTQYAYDVRGQMTEQVETLADRTKVTRDTAGNIVRVNLPNGDWREFNRGTGGKILSIRESGGATFISADGKQFRLQGSSDVITAGIEIDRNGVYRFRHDDGKVVQRELDGSVSVLDGYGTVRSRRTATGAQVSYDQAGRVSESIDPKGSVRKFGYTGNRLSSITQPNGDVFTSIDGKKWAGTGGGEERTGSCSVDRSGNLTVELSGRKFVHRNDGVSVEFDGAGRARSITYVDGLVRSFEYDAKGEPNKVRHPNGGIWNRGANNVWQQEGANHRWSGRLEVLADGSHREIGSDYSRVYRVDGWQETTNRTGKRLDRQNPDGSWQTLNDKGQITATIDARGAWRRFEYDGSGKLNKVTDASGTLSTTDGTSWSHDKSGKIEQLRVNVSATGSFRVETAIGRATTRLLDGATIEAGTDGRFIKIVCANGKEAVFTYDETGKMSRSVLPDKTVLVTADGGKSWSKEGDNSSRKFTVEISRNGSIIQTDQTGGQRTEYCGGGRIFTLDRNKRSCYDEKPDGTYERRTFVAGSGRVATIERKLSDGTIWHMTGNVIDAIRLRSNDGQYRAFSLKSGRWELNGSAPDTRDLILVHERLGHTYETLGLTRAARASYQHAIVHQEKLYKPGDTALAINHDRVALLCGQLNDTRSAGRHQYEATEIRRVASYLEQLRRAGDAAGYTSTIVSRMPKVGKIEADHHLIRLSSDSFIQMLQAIPGLRLAESTAVGVKSFALDGNKLKLEGNASFTVVAEGRPIKLSLTNVNGELKIDPRDQSRITLANITGLTVEVSGVRLSIKEVAFTLVEDRNGNLTLRAVPKLEGAPPTPRPSGNASVLNRLGQFGGSLVNGSAAVVANSLIKPMDIPLGNKRETPLGTLYGDVKQWIGTERKDAGRLAEKVAEIFMDRSLAGLLRGLKGVERDGDRLTITSQGGDLRSLGGIPIEWDRTVRARLVADGRKIEIKDIVGARIKMPLPGDLAASLGMKNPIEISIKELSLSEPDKHGNRTASVKADGIIESVSIKVGPNMQPVAVDRAGNVAMNFVINKGGRLPLELVFNPRQAMEGDPKKVDFKLTVKGEDPDKVAKVVEGFFGHDLDPVLYNALKGVVSVEKKGDQVTIERKEASNLSIEGLTVRIDKQISFKIKPDHNDISISNIRGLSIRNLPDVADLIYRRRLPIYVNSFKLSAADHKGGRTITIASSGALRGATIKMDASMTPKDIELEIENPVQALKEVVQRDAAMAMLAQRTRGNDTYIIRIRDGAADIGGLRNISNMFSNAGDLLSLEGIASTVIGYAGNKVSGAGAQAELGVADAFRRTWNAIFD